MNAATDDPMFFTTTDFFDEVPMALTFTSQSHSTIPPSSVKFQCPAYPPSATEWPFQYSLDPLSAKPHSDPFCASDHSEHFSTKQPPITGSSVDLNPHLACPSSVAYMDATTTSWMMNSLENAYLPDFNQSLGFYEENQNDENAFHPYQPHPYISQDTLSSSLPSHLIPSSYSQQHNLTHFFDATPFPLPDEYFHANCTESFPNLPHSFTNHEAVGHDVQSFLGYMPREPSPHTTNRILSHSHIDPEPPNSYPDINEGIDDLSDSDTTTSTQSWRMPLPQDPFHSCHDDDLSTSTFHPVGGGMVSSISTPVFGFYHIASHHPNHNNGIPAPSGCQPMKYKSQKPAKTNTKQRQQQHKRVHRSNSSHTIHSSGVSSRKKPLATTIHSQRNDLKRRASEPYLLSTVPSFSTTTTNAHLEPATRTVSTSESIASILSRQKLLDLEEEEMDHDPFTQSTTLHDESTNRQHRHHVHSKISRHRPESRRHFAEGELDHKSNESDENDTSRVKMLPPPNHGIKKGRNVDKACNHCKRSHLRCDSMRPCRRCIATGKSGCQDVEHKPRGRPRLHNT